MLKEIKKITNKRILYIIEIILVACISIILVTIYLNSNISKKDDVKNNIDMDPIPLKDGEATKTIVGYGAKGALADEYLTVVDMLTYALQDEYLAHGEYQAIIDKFGSQKPYSNIILSEETHISYLREIYKSYNIEFPSDSSETNIVIPNNLLEAAQTGVQAEIDNIAMYEKFLTYDLPDSVRDIFIILKDGSKNHLNSFQKQVDKLS